MRRYLLTAVAIASVLLGLYVLLPAIAGLDDTWERLREGDPWWLVAAVGFEALSFGSYIVYFGAVFGRESAAIDWRVSYRITMAGVVATRLLAAAGLGGVALTAWALRGTGMGRRDVAASMGTFYVLLYGIFMSALVVGGVTLRTGLVSGPAPWALTVLPAVFGAGVIVASLLVAWRASDVHRAGERLAPARTALGRAKRVAYAVPATIASGVGGALWLAREHEPRLLGAAGWWGFDIAVLGASLSAFGDAPAVAIVVMAYFVGMLANTLPVPGGIGAVDGGMIGALIGFGVDPGLAIVGVLTYRAFAFWLPILPGALAYAQLLRGRSAT